MTRDLNFSVLDDKATDDLDLDMESARSRRWSSRDVNPTVQMSVRMPEEEYTRFRALCKRERRTNGEMLNILVESYLTLLREEKKQAK